jgi:glycosyltransferase involved in cell wall biosynthesis
VAPLARLAQKALNAVGVSLPQVLRHARLLRKERIDILHLNNGVQVGAEWVVAAKLVGVKVMFHQRGIDPVSKWNTWLARRVDHVICVSEAARAHLIANGLSPLRCTAVHNGINQEALQRQLQRSPAEVRATLGIAPDTLIIGLAGMIRRWKGQLVLVRAMAKLRAAHPNVRAIIMGGTSDRNTEDQAYLAEVKALIRASSLQDQILMLDYQPNAPEFLQIFDIMVHTAIEPEPFSRVVIEGMALERPIVASANGGTPEAIEDGVSGLLVPPDDADALAEKIDLLIRRPELRAALGREAKLKVERQFLISVHVERTRAIYEQVLKGQPA